MHNSLSKSQVIALIQAFASSAATGITSVVFNREENNNLIFVVTFTDNTTQEVTVPINDDFEVIYILRAGSTNKTDNGNYRMLIDPTSLQLVFQKREAGQWIQKLEVASLITNLFILEDLAAALVYVDSSDNQHVLVKPSVSGKGGVFGEPTGRTYLMHNGTLQSIDIDNSNQLNRVLNAAETENQQNTTFTIPFTTTIIETILSGTIKLANVPANTRMRASLTDSLGNDIGENNTPTEFRENTAQQVSNGDVSITIKRPFAMPESFAFNLKLEFSNSVQLLGSTIDLQDTRGPRFIPKLNFDYYTGTEDDITTEKNIVNQLESKPAGEKLDYETGLRNHPIRVRGYDNDIPYRRGDILQSPVNEIEHLFIAQQAIQAGQGAPTSIDDYGTPWIAIDLKAGRGPWDPDQRYEFGNIVSHGGFVWMSLDNNGPTPSAPSDTNSSWLRFGSPRTNEEIQDVIAGLVVAGNGMTITYDDESNTLIFASSAVGGKEHTDFSSSAGQINPTMSNAGNFFEFTGNTTGELHAGVFLPASVDDGDLYKFFTFQNRGTVPQIVRGAGTPGHTFSLLGGTLPYNIEPGTGITLEVIQRSENATTYAITNIDVISGASGTSEGSMLTAATLSREDYFLASGDKARLNHTYSMESSAADKSFTIGPYADFNLINGRSNFFNVSNPHATNWLKVINSNGNFLGMSTDTFWLAPGELKKFELVRSGNDYFLYPVGKISYNFEAESGLLVPNSWTLQSIYGLPSELLKLKEGGTNQIEFKLDGILVGLRVDLMWNFNGTAAADFASLIVRTPSINLRKNGTANTAGHDSSVINLAGAKVGYHQEFDPVVISEDDYFDITGTDLTDILGTTVSIRGEYVLKAY